MFNMSRSKVLETDTMEPLFSAPTTPEKKRAERWLTDRFSRAVKEGFFIEPQPVLITPVLAELMLTHNTTNRHLRKARVSRFARILREGRWVIHLQGISFNQNSDLDNGQHRLHAIVETGIGAHMTVAFGQTQAAFAIIDTQGPRTTADSLHIAGEKYSSVLAAAARMLKIVIGTQPRGNQSFDNDEMLTFLEEHPDLRNSCKYAYVGQQNKAAPTPFVVAHYLISQACKRTDQVEVFFSAVATGLGLTSKTDPVWVLRKLLAEGHVPGKTRTDIAAAIIIAWNSWSRGKRLRSVDWEDETIFPVVE